jgi:hypothetical protein
MVIISEHSGRLELYSELHADGGGRKRWQHFRGCHHVSQASAMQSHSKTWRHSMSHMRSLLPSPGSRTTATMMSAIAKTSEGPAPVYRCTAAVQAIIYTIMRKYACVDQQRRSGCMHGAADGLTHLFNCTRRPAGTCLLILQRLYLLKTSDVVRNRRIWIIE